MGSSEIKDETLNVRISAIRLLSLSYRVKTTEPSLTEESDDRLRGSIGISFSARRKHNFKLRTRNEVKVGRVSFRATHEAKFVSDDPLSKDIFENEDFKGMVINMLMPFTSELFATLTGKSFITPIIAPDELPTEEENEKEH